MKGAVLLVLAVLVLATVQAERVTKHGKIPSSWKKMNRVEPETPIRLHFAIKQKNLKQLENTLLAVSDPASPFYGKHLTFEQTNALVAPSTESVAAVRDWLKESGVKHIEANSNADFISATVPARTAEHLLQTTFFHYRHTSGRSLIRSHQTYSLPSSVAKHIDVVGPTTRFPAVKELKKRTTATPEALVNPTSLRKLYSVGSYVASSGKSSQAIASFLEQYYSPKDLSAFFKKYDPASVSRNVTVVGPNDASNPGIEASLDIEYIMAMGAGVDTTFWYQAGRQPGNPDNEPFLDFLFLLSNTSNAPWVFSISYGDNEDTVDLDYATRVNVEFQKAGVRGVSILASSGDGGVSGSQPTSCQQFIPTYPAASPWVTAVGGTSGTTERGASLSGGGFSNRWARPDYQKTAIENYLKTAHGLPDTSLFNVTGAGFPDVAAQAEDYVIVCGGFTQPVSGTSCSSPAFAGIVALLNDIRLAKGKPTLGFLNPLFYANAGAFNDIVSGSNPGCSTDGFPAAAGWDPVTGLGSPNFAKLSQIVSNLP